MAAKLDKEMLKKQHFWLLLIPVVIGLLLAWVGLFVGVADATDTKKSENEAAKAEVERATAQARLVLPPGRTPAQELPRYKAFLKVETHRLKMLHRAGGSGREVCRARAAILDVLIRHLWDTAKAGLSAAIAIGYQNGGKKYETNHQHG